jgi:hypothetical protein
MTRTKSCELCGSNEFGEILNSEMQECRKCTVQYPSEVPHSGVVTNQFPISPSGRGSFLARSQARLVKPLYSNKQLIDIGCGNGAFLYAINRQELKPQKIMGVELDPRSSQAAADAGVLVTSEIPPNVRNALITMWHVAEHIAVDEFKRLLSELQHSSNSLLISVPNGNSYSWIKFGKKFSFYDSKSHLIQYTPRSLRKILVDTGWKIDKEFYTPVYGLFNAFQTGINLYRPHNEIYQSVKREGNPISTLILLKTLVPILRAIRPIFMMSIYELKKQKCSSYTILSSGTGF